LPSILPASGKARAEDDRRIAADAAGYDYLSVSFGYTAELWRFWQRCGFMLVRWDPSRGQQRLLYGDGALPADCGRASAGAAGNSGCCAMNTGFARGGGIRAAAGRRRRYA
jgi:hypothetical protein